jgi:signal transduction histidine kinase
MNSTESPRAPQARPTWIVNAAIVIAAGLSLLLVALAVRLPALPYSLVADGKDVVTFEFPGAVGSRHVVSALRQRGVGAETFELEPGDLIEEPDVIGSWSELNRFYARQGKLWQLLQGSELEASVDGTFRRVKVVERGLADLPLGFYAQLLAALVVWVVGFVTYAFSDRGLAARIYAITAVAFYVIVWPAALYSTRPLALQPELFRLFSTVDHAGGLFFAAGVIALLAVYPVRLVKSIPWLWIFAGAMTLAGHFQWGDIAVSGFYTANAIQFVIFVGFALWQRRASRSNPVHRAALGWILLSMFVGVIFYFALITVPVLLGLGPTISQATGFLSMVLMYVGISLGVLRVRLFELDRWWFRTWSWILSGAIVVGSDLLLTRLFELRHELALVIALLVVGWLYFPVRQLLWTRFLKVGAERQYDARRLITARTPEELRTRFEEALKWTFAPLEILSESVRLALEARSEGETAERARIRRDLHDDLGASIIRIAHEAPDSNTAGLAKAAMRDLRDVLTALDVSPSACADVLDDLEADLRARAQADGRDVEWTVSGSTSGVLAARSRANLTRALRESMTNALRHGRGTIRYALALSETELEVTIGNGDGNSGPVEIGMGLGNVQSRMAELGGRASYSRTEGGFELRLRLPLAEDP